MTFEKLDLEKSKYHHKCFSLPTGARDLRAGLYYKENIRGVLLQK